MKKSFVSWKVLCVHALLISLSSQSWAVENCELVIKKSTQSGDEISFDIHSSKANLTPYKVSLRQVGKTVASWRSVAHKSKDPLRMRGVTASGNAIVRIESTKDKNCFVEQEIVVSPTRPTVSSANTCDFIITDFSQVSGSLLFDLYSSRANINPYNVRLVQGSKEIGNWKNIPHSMGQLLKVEGATGSGDATVTITSTKDATCTAQRVIKLETQTASDSKACKQGPKILNILNVSNTGLIAQFHGEDVFGIDYIIQTSSGTVLRNGSVRPANSTPSINFAPIPKGKYSLLFKGNTCVGESSKEFSVTTGEEASTGGNNDGALSSCKAGPEIKYINNISGSGLSALFHGVDVFEIKYKILNGLGASVATGIFKPDNNTPNLSFPTLGAGDYTLVFDGSSCVGSSQMTFKIPGSTGPTEASTSSGSAGGGGLKACDAGPEIKDISSVTTTGLVAQFHGVNVTGLDYVISNSAGGVAYTGSVAPKNSSPAISYTKLVPGSYTLLLKGSACSGQSSKAFTIPEVSSGGDSVVLDPVVTGNIVPRNMVRGLPEHMNIQISGSSENWIINDAASITPPNGYEFQYQINGQIIRQTTPLRNFPWPSNNEIGIYKAQIKHDVDTLNKWECPSNGYYQCDAAVAFSHNVSLAFAQFAFADSGPGNFNPENRRVQWMDLISDFNDPTHGVWYVSIGKISTPESLLKKGATHFSRGQVFDRPDKDVHLNAGRLYNDVQMLPAQLGLSERGGSNWVPAGQSWPNVWNTRFFEATSGAPLTPEQGRQKGEQYSIDSTVMVFENTEQDHAVGAQWPFWREYYKALNTRMQDRWGSKGIPYYIAHNYFTTFGGSGITLGDGGIDANKAILKTPISQWPSNELLPGGTLEYTNATCFGIYLNAPDINLDVSYKIMFSAEVNKKANKKLLLFMQPMHEWKPNNLQEISYPDGKFYHYTKLPHNPAQAKSYGFLSRAFASGMIFFGSGPKSNEQFQLYKEYHDGLWLANGSEKLEKAREVNFPYWAPPSGNEVFPSSGADDMVAFGIDLYNRTFAPTRGGDRKFLKYRLNSGAWVNAVNSEMDDLVDAYYTKKGVMFSQMKDGKLSVFYLNPYADNAKYNLDFEHNGKTYSMTVQSSGVHAKLINL